MQELFELKYLRFDSVLKANKAINAMYEGLKKVNRGFSGMHAPRGLPAEINHMSAVTASYVQRLESEGKTYEANKVKSKAYAESLNYLNRKQKSLETQLGKIAEKSGKASQTYKEQQVRINATATSISKLKPVGCSFSCSFCSLLIEVAVALIRTCCSL